MFFDGLIAFWCFFVDCLNHHIENQRWMDWHLTNKHGFVCQLILGHDCHLGWTWGNMVPLSVNNVALQNHPIMIKSGDSRWSSRSTGYFELLGRHQCFTNVVLSESNMFATVCFMSFVPLHGKYSSQQLLPKFVMRSLVLLKQEIVFLGPGWLNNQALCSQYPNHSPVVEPLPFLLLTFFPEQLSSVFSQHLLLLLQINGLASFKMFDVWNIQRNSIETVEYSRGTSLESYGSYLEYWSYLEYSSSLCWTEPNLSKTWSLWLSCVFF